MKKRVFLAMAIALFAGKAMSAQTEQEVRYVEDPAQGYLVNTMSDNWFISADGGAGIWFTEEDSRRKLTDRFAPAAGLYVGKWFSPIFGFRAGFSYLQTKGVTSLPDASGVLVTEPRIDGDYYKTKINYFGGMVDAMLSVNNWIWGYNPDRRYNLIVYAGAGIYWPYEHKYSTSASGQITDDGWKYFEDRTLTARGGIINEYRFSERFSLGLDLRCSFVDNHSDPGMKIGSDVQALINATYRIGKSRWYAPIVPVCPPAENCDEFRNRLQAADTRISDLEAQLRDCLDKLSSASNQPVVKEIKPALATIYYPCNVSRLTAIDQKVVAAVAEVMKANPDKKYIVTGWADNYTGNDVINVNLRKNRAAGVEKALLRNGVKASQLEVTINNGNLCDLGEKCLSLDRAVTIEEAH